jgi:hypothetical protein
MRDLKPVEELSDARLAELSAKARPNTDLEAAKDAVFDLEIKLREAQTHIGAASRKGQPTPPRQRAP